MDINVIASIIACGVTLLGCAITTGTIVWRGGRQTERIETAVALIEKHEVKLEIVGRIPLLERGQQQLEHIVSRMQSDHAALRARLDETRDRAIRAEMASQHDLGGDS